MDADDQNVEAGITGAGSARPPATMRAVVLDAPGPPSALAIRELPVPVPSVVLIGRVYRFDQIVEAHTDMEQNRVSGKLVVTT